MGEGNDTLRIRISFSSLLGEEEVFRLLEEAGIAPYNLEPGDEENTYEGVFLYYLVDATNYQHFRNQIEDLSILLKKIDLLPALIKTKIYLD